jgi:hypothetical protein
MLYPNTARYHLFLAALLFFFVLIDLGQFFFAGMITIPLLLCFYCTVLVGTATPALLLVCMALLQCLESFCFYNQFFLPFIYLTPITLVAFFFKRNLYPSLLHGATVALLSAITQIWFVDRYFLHLAPATHYTLMRIGGTLLVTICFSLTINIWGMQDNRG